MKMGTKMLLWTPRVLGIAVCAFLGIFALDAFSEGIPLPHVLGDFLIHLLPALVLLGTVAIAWHREWVGAVVFVAAAAWYSFIARRHLDWVLGVAGPLLVVGALFAWSWRHHDELHAR